MLIVDDLLLFRVLASTAPPEVMPELEAGELYTTGCWYYRLSRAVHDRRSAGVLSREFNTLDEDKQHAVLSALDDLPSRVGLISLRRLVPIMSVLDLERPVNMLAAEALASALLVSGTIAVTTDNPLVREASSALAIGYSVLP